MLKRGGVHILCATAGRLMDLLASNQGRISNFCRTTYVVLDEADRMFDKGEASLRPGSFTSRSRTSELPPHPLRGARRG